MSETPTWILGWGWGQAHWLENHVCSLPDAFGKLILKLMCNPDHELKLFETLQIHSCTNFQWNINYNAVMNTAPTFPNKGYLTKMGEITSYLMRVNCFVQCSELCS